MANINPTGIDELEGKKWLVHRIDLYHKTMRETLENEIQKFENKGKEDLSKIRSYRNNILSGLGVILTVVLGINATYPLTQFLFFGVLTTLGVISLIVIILFNIVIRIIEDLISSISEIYNSSIGNIVSSEAYMITSVAHISRTPLGYIDNYFAFTMLLSYAIMVYSSNQLKKLSKKYSKIPQIKSELSKSSKNFEQNLDQIPKVWSLLDPKQPVSPSLLEFVNTNLAEYKPKN